MWSIACIARQLRNLLGLLGMEDKLKRRLQIPAAQFLLGIAGVAAITYVCFWVGFGIGRTAFVYLILIALVSLLGIFSVSVVLSIIAVACLNYFFVPPLFEFRVNDPDDIVRLATFLATTLIVTALIGKLRTSEVRFRAFADHATDAFFLLSDELIVLDVNRQACVSLGYSREELIGMHSTRFRFGFRRGIHSAPKAAHRCRGNGHFRHSPLAQGRDFLPGGDPRRPI